MATELDELIGFLSFPSPQVKKVAIDIVRDLTGSEDGSQSLFSRADAAIPALVLILRDPPELSAPAAEALINLSQDPALSENIVAHGAVRITMEVLGKPACPAEIVGLLVMLLVNLTQLESGVNALLQVGDETEGLHIAKLVRSFSRSSTGENAVKDPYEYVGSIFVNISKIEAGRRILLESKWNLLKQIIPQYDSTNPLRKKGVSGCVHNCCFEADNKLQNLLLISEFLWPVLLLPVAGKKVYSQKDTSKMPLELANALSHEREYVEDAELRIQALESIYLIALQEAGRKSLWAVNGPRILQVGYEDEEDPKVMEAYEQIGSLLVDNNGNEVPETLKTCS